MLFPLCRSIAESGCVFNSNGSVNWLKRNWGPFSDLVSVQDLLSINPLFSPVCLHVELFAHLAQSSHELGLSRLC